ncbi:endonuclease/exonuclease/phosphatase family protein [Nannocystis sp. SCPEA4]|uniref:endonuclease/exonuclease/phosphatase family protein n=1 Tax=Nannocystis sp. SCPEA4 TaxID=2996787 RepID=UPI00227165BD|nr:endonuclease/exonuclease/phosphatase family protein [Nannocystis sp. SCPEA4]
MPTNLFAYPNLVSEPGPLPLRSQLDHDFTDALAHIARIRTRRRLERDPVFRTIRPQLERVLRGFEWDLEPTLGHSLAPRRPGIVRAVAWNVERGKRFEGLHTLLTSDPELTAADLLLLTEVDIGMGRSGNRNVPKELAHALGMGYVFANYHIVLVEGDRGERGHGVPNTKAMHGCALLTRFPVLRFEAVELHERRDKFHATEKRIGNKRALLCELLLPDGPLTVALVHLDPFAGPRDRARHIREIVARLREFGGERMLLGGDLNTNTYDLSSGRGLAYNFFYKLTRFGIEGMAAQYMKPEEHFERAVFAAMREGGFEIDGFNDFTRGTIYYDIYDPEIFRKALDYMPKAMRRVMWTYLERRLAPWGGRVPLRVDWFAGKGLRPRAPQVIERPVAEGKLVSDHNPILVDLELGPDGESDMSEESDE